ncbi:MAG: YraN family protein [Aureispira sp.]|nr:YraN family protein [Aureispira sp.]
MAKHNEIGELGEQIAQKYLQAQEYRILTTNWRWGKGEVDIIAQKGEVLVFVEVKTRTNNNFGQPEEAVTTKKQQLFYELAVEYMYQINYEQEFRFDIIAIVLEPKQDIQHYQDAFFPTW